MKDVSPDEMYENAKMNQATKEDGGGLDNEPQQHKKWYHYLIISERS